MLVEEIREEADRAVARSTSGGSRGEPASSEESEADLRSQLVRAVGPERAVRLERRVKEASRAFAAERFPEARTSLAAISREAPSVVAVRELLGLTLYRLGRWKAAAAELEVFGELTGSTEQYPVLADCYRALRRYDRVDELWEELRAASPDADVVMEGRIVAAGALADRGKLREAIALMQKPGRVPRRPAVRHLRRAYVLGDLYEQVGDVPRAREWFKLVRDHDPDFADVRQRLRSLG